MVRRVLLLGVLGLVATTTAAAGAAPRREPPSTLEPVVDLLPAPVADEGQEAALLGGRARWPDPNLTYGFASRTPDLSETAQRSAIRRALGRWSAVSRLSFTEVADCGLPVDAARCATPDIRFGFYRAAHGPAGDPAFDGPGGIVAHGVYPVPDTGTIAGDVHFDDAETWSTTGHGVDLETVAVHEIGHALGVKHSGLLACLGRVVSLLRPTMCSVMLPPDHSLAPDDVAAIRSLYGRAGSDCAGFPVTVVIADGDRTTAGDDVVLGRPTADTVDGRGGRDVLCGGGGNDSLVGGAGADRLYGGPGQDSCDGSTGIDVVSGCEVRRRIP